MTFADLFSQIASDSGDESINDEARRWLNFTRSYLYGMHDWRNAFVADGTLTTAADTAHYLLEDVGKISGDRFFDETNTQVIVHESRESLNSFDPARDVTGPPNYWADTGGDPAAVTGASSAADRRIMLWPIPDSAYTLRFDYYKPMFDIERGGSQDYYVVDPYFGLISEWAHVFLAGMRYYHDLNTNEDPQQIAFQLQTFERLARRKKARDPVAPTSSTSLKIIRHMAPLSSGRLDPAHYRNP